MLRRNTLANFAGRGWVALITFAFVPVYINYLGLEAYGLIGVFILLQTWMTLLDAGMTPTLTREMAKFGAGMHTPFSIRQLLRTLEFGGTALGVIIALGVAASASWLAGSWIRPEQLTQATVSRALSLIGVMLGLRLIEGLYRGSLLGLERHVRLNVALAVAATVRGVGSWIVLEFVSSTVNAFFTWQATVSVLTLIAMRVLTYSCLPRAERRVRPALASLVDIRRFAAGMLGITMLSLLLTQIDKVILSNALTLADYGTYTVAATLAAGLYMLIAPVSQAWLPRLTALWAEGSGERLASTFHQGAELATLVLAPAAIALIAFSGPILRLWTGDEALASSAAPLLAMLTLGNFLNGLMHLPYQGQLAHGWTSLAVRMNIVLVVILVPLILFATPRFGAVGAATVWVLTNVINLTIGSHLMFRRILRSEQREWMIDDILRPIGPAVVVAAALAFVIPMPATRLPLAMVLAACLVAIVAVMAMSSVTVRRLLRQRISPVGRS